MTTEVTQYAYGQDYPYFLEMKRLTGRFSYDLWIATRAFWEVYFPLGLKSGDRILDVGSCMGNLGGSLKFGGVKTYGIDLNLPALQNSRISGSQAQGSAVNVPFSNNFFDYVVSSDLFEHLPNAAEAEKALKEMERVNKSQRMLHKITVLEDKDWIHADESHRIKWPAKKWKSWFEENGWKVVKSTTKTFPVWSRREIGVGKMHGYFLLERFM